MRRRLTWDVFKWSWLGGVCFGLNVALYFTSVRMTSIANVAIIGSLTPVIVFPIAVKWMGERVTRKAIVCSALAIAGVVVVVLAGGSSGERVAVGRPARRREPRLVGRVLPRDQARPQGRRHARVPRRDDARRRDHRHADRVADRPGLRVGRRASAGCGSCCSCSSRAPRATG